MIIIKAFPDASRSPIFAAACVKSFNAHDHTNAAGNSVLEELY